MLTTPMRPVTSLHEELGEVGRLAPPFVVGSAIWLLVLIAGFDLLFAIPLSVAQREGAGRPSDARSGPGSD
jgi:hypothetical protein